MTGTGGEPPTDRRIRTAADLAALRMDPDGLIPVVAQDSATGSVLMVAWANRDALRETLSSGEMHYWSRSRKELWRKGATSGNVQQLVSLHADCDGDTLLARVTPAGPACHTGDLTCFGAGSADSREARPSFVEELWAVVESRDRQRPEGSYTTRLLSDENLRLKKLGEEMAELVSELARGGDQAPGEAADLIFHVLVALRGAGWSWGDVETELRKRRG